ncbi:hypothetical protein GCM10010198_14880 [Nocardia seriolae]|nr:hypothetical protein NSERKGN1266_09570 [Nocardia seriolae]BEK99151.1 hypothetical protein NSER024013_70570 [Nocardia seriolae]GAM44220.1 hypothetical protein NS07_v2contig00001-0069 [Nocardia seriolae]GEM21830.1 hypothetical protein NS2_00690 [Nocardia seriolae NBRC 15557]
MNTRFNPNIPTVPAQTTTATATPATASTATRRPGTTPARTTDIHLPKPTAGHGTRRRTPPAAAPGPG